MIELPPPYNIGGGIEMQVGVIMRDNIFFTYIAKSLFKK